MIIELDDDERDVLLMTLNNAMCPYTGAHGILMYPRVENVREIHEIYRKISGKDCEAWLDLLAMQKGN